MGQTKPSGHGSWRIISYIHISWKIKSANYTSQEYPCTTRYEVIVDKRVGPIPNQKL